MSRDRKAIAPSRSMRPEYPAIALARGHADAIEIFEQRDEILSRHINDLLEVGRRKFLTHLELRPEYPRHLVDLPPRHVELLIERDDPTLRFEKLEEKPELLLGAGERGQLGGGGRGEPAPGNGVPDPLLSPLLLGREPGLEAVQRDGALANGEALVAEEGFEHGVGEPCPGAGREGSAELLVIDPRAERVPFVVRRHGVQHGLPGGVEDLAIERERADADEGLPILSVEGFLDGAG